MKSNLLHDSRCAGEVILTIAIPTYKRLDLLIETLQRTFTLKFTIPFEIIIVDNDSDNFEIAEECISFFKNEKFAYYKNINNYGACGNWNRCLELAEGKLVTILHDDDYLHNNFPNELERIIRNVRDINDFNLIGFDAIYSDQRKSKDTNVDNFLFKNLKKALKYIQSLTKEKNKNEISNRGIKELAVAINGGFHSTLGVVMNREKALEIGGFNNEWYPILDYDFYVRWVNTYGPVQFKNTIVATYRILENDSVKESVRRGVVNKNYELRMLINNSGDGIPYLARLAKYSRDYEEYTTKMYWGENKEVVYKDLIKAVYSKVMFHLFLRLY
jgi:glycosyltransferase involved in cell wall biosynthesis